MTVKSIKKEHKLFFCYKISENPPIALNILMATPPIAYNPMATPPTAAPPTTGPAAPVPCRLPERRQD